jgi:DNA-binding transcriptional MerR regulator
MTEITNITSAFSADQVVRLTGLSMRQLTYWDNLGFFRPQYAAEDRKTPFSRIYSFKDVVGLRTLSILKSKYRCSLPHLQMVARDLASYSEAPWAEIKLYVLKRKVQFQEPETGRLRGVVDGQYALLPISSVMEDVRWDRAGFFKVERFERGGWERTFVGPHT